MESVTSAHMSPNVVPATMESQPRPAIPKRSKISGCTGPPARLRGCHQPAIDVRAGRAAEPFNRPRNR